MQTKKLFKVDIKDFDEQCGVCFVGRNEKKGPVHMLVMPEDACEAICHAIETMDAERIHPDVRDTFKTMQKNDELMNTLIRGIILPNINAENFKEIPLSSAVPEEKAAGQRTTSAGLISRNKTIDDNVTLSGSEVRKASVVIAARDASEVPPELT